MYKRLKLKGKIGLQPNSHLATHLLPCCFSRMEKKEQDQESSWVGIDKYVVYQ